MTYTIYYCWDEHGQPLYVGRTSRALNKRLSEHRRGSRWWEWVAHVTSQTVTEIDKKFARLNTTDEHKLQITASVFENAEIRRLAPSFNLYAQPDRSASIKYLASRGWYDRPAEARTAA